MLLYGIALVPLAESLRKAEPTVLQPWYANDAAMTGPVDAIARAMRLLEEQGPARGYYPEPEKSIFVPSTPEVATECQDRLKDHNFQHRPGHRYIGGFHRHRCRLVGVAGTADPAMDPRHPQALRGR